MAQTAGVPFNVIVEAVDSYWNTVATVTDVATFTSSDAYAVLPTNMALANGTGSFSVALKKANANRTVTARDATDTGKTSDSSSIPVLPGPFVKLQLPMPGENALTGSPGGKSGTPAPQIAGTACDVTDSGKLSYTAPPTPVNAGAFSRLQLLVPGEVAAPGTLTGKTGSPLPQFTGQMLTVDSAEKPSA